MVTVATIVGTARSVRTFCSITQKMKGSPLVRPCSEFCEARDVIGTSGGTLTLTIGTTTRKSFAFGWVMFGLLSARAPGCDRGRVVPETPRSPARGGREDGVAPPFSTRTAVPGE